MSVSPGQRPEIEQDTGSPLPLRATGIVLSAWIVGLVVIALVVVPVLFATCFPAPGL